MNMKNVVFVIIIMIVMLQPKISHAQLDIHSDSIQLITEYVFIEDTKEYMRCETGHYQKVNEKKWEVYQNVQDKSKQFEKKVAKCILKGNNWRFIILCKNNLPKEIFTIKD